MLFTIGAIAASVALAEPTCANACEASPVTLVRPAAPIIDVRERYVDQDLGSSGYEILDDDGISETSRRNRERLGAGDDAPCVIYVRVFDGVFAIDPFEPVEQLVPRPTRGRFQFRTGANAGETLSVQRQVFGEFSLQTNRSLFDWKRVEATAELFSRLESARQEWLRTNGYLGVRTFVNENPEAQETTSVPEPRAIFRRPVDVPKTQPHEEVRRDTAPDAAQVGRALASTGKPMRISKPGFDLSVARVSKPTTGTTAVASR
ncbi:MAG: hypothetical protein R3B57_07745 [Phycisphaerales bacterium]